MTDLPMFGRWPRNFDYMGINAPYITDEQYIRVIQTISAWNEIIKPYNTAQGRYIPERDQMCADITHSNLLHRMLIGGEVREGPHGNPMNELRKFERKDGTEWKEVMMIELREGDIFRISNDPTVEGVVYKATARAYPQMETKIYTIPCEEYKGEV